MKTDFSTKSIVITGASSGIGETLARKAAARGAQVALAARSADRLERILCEIKADGGDAIAVPTDVTRRDDVFELAEAAISKFGKIDVWINNAGASSNLPIERIGEDEFNAAMAVNLKGALYGTQAVIGHMRERDMGHIINVSSIAAKLPFGISGSYVMSKFALNGLTMQTRLELFGTGVFATAAMPGRTVTPLGENVLKEGLALDLDAIIAEHLPHVDVPKQLLGLLEEIMAPQTADQCAEAILDIVGKNIPEFFPNPAHETLPRRLAANTDDTLNVSAPITLAIKRWLKEEGDGGNE